MNLNRIEKLNNLIKNELNTFLLQHKELYTGAIMLTVYSVKVSEDISIARVNVSVLLKNEIDKKRKKEIIDSLNEKNMIFKSYFSQNVGKNWRKVPKFIFHEDRSAELLEEVENALKKTKL